MTVTVSWDRPKRDFGQPGRLRRAAKALASGTRAAAAAAIRPHRASLKRLTEMPLTVAAVPCADFAAFHLAHGWGWLATAVSLIVVEHMISDED